MSPDNKLNLFPFIPFVKDVLCRWALGPGLPSLLRQQKFPTPITHFVAVGGKVSRADGSPLFTDGKLLSTDSVTTLLSPLAPASQVAESDKLDFLMPAPLTGDQIVESETARRESKTKIDSERIDPSNRRRPKALLLVIDNSISLAHPNFRIGQDKSRIEAAWMMDAIPRTGQDPDAEAPFGRFWQRGQIEQKLAEHGDDFDALLRAFGQDPAASPALPLGFANTAHGTQIADLAAGIGPLDDDLDPEEVRLLTVQLPSLVYWDTAGAMLGFFAIAGLKRMLDYAYSTPDLRDVPIVVAFSYAITGGPHDGSHYIERLIAEVIDAHRKRGGARVYPLLPAGNSYDDRRHARGKLVDGHTLTWQIPPGDRSPNFLEIWVPMDAGEVTVTLTAPDGADIAADGGTADLKSGDTTIARIDHEGGFAGDLRRILVVVGPTTTETLFNPGELPDPISTLGQPFRATFGDPLDGVRSPPGAWKVTIYGTSEEVFRAWIHRDDFATGFMGQEPQSYLIDPIYEDKLDERPPGTQSTTVPDDADSRVKRSGTLSGIAGGRRTLVVGAHRARDGILARYSAAADYGPPMSKLAPAMTAPADTSVIRPGLIAAGNRSGGKRARSGTSAGVPIIARWLLRQICGGNTVHLPPFDLCGVPPLPDWPGKAELERSGTGPLRLRPLPGVNTMRLGEHSEI